MDPIDRVYADYSCDMNNDLIIDNKDLMVVIEDILETELGDFDLDGTKDNDDRALIVTNMNTAGTYADGDITGDGTVNCKDLAAFDGVVVELSEMDFNEDCIVNFQDFAPFANEWLKTSY
jgi:hypothetical protein